MKDPISENIQPSSSFRTDRHRPSSRGLASYTYLDRLPVNSASGLAEKFVADEELIRV